MKYVCLNQDNFDRPHEAYLCAFLQLNATIFVEVVNIYNLVTITTMLDIIMNFIALGVLSEFDDEFLVPFMTSKL